MPGKDGGQGGGLILGWTGISSREVVCYSQSLHVRKPGLEAQGLDGALLKYRLYLTTYSLFV